MHGDGLQLAACNRFFAAYRLLYNSGSSNEADDARITARGVMCRESSNIMACAIIAVDNTIFLIVIALAGVGMARRRPVIGAKYLLKCPWPREIRRWKPVCRRAPAISAGAYYRSPSALQALNIYNGAKVYLAWHRRASMEGRILKRSAGNRRK